MPHFSKNILLVFVSIVALVATIFAVTSRNKLSPICETHQTPFSYTVCHYYPDSKAKLQLLWQDPSNGNLLLNFTKLKSLVNNSKNHLIFAMNAGMYDAKFAPIGYTIINGKQVHSLNLKQGSGNFHLMPNGVFWWDKQGYYVTESQLMAKKLASGTKPLFATQSGPMLVIDGKIHPRFDPKSTSLKQRNGVGICQDGSIQFVISDSWVNFYQFANLFKTQLHCDNALFLDGGSASALYSEELKRMDDKYMGVMIAVTNTY